MRQPEGQRLGVVWFHDPHQHAAGWAARAYEEPFLISGPQELPSDTKWLTNLEYQLMHESGLARHDRFRQDNFLRQRLPTLVDQLGIPVEDAPARVMAAVGVADRVTRLARALLGMYHIPQFTLAQGVRELIANVDPILPPEIVRACDAATEATTFVERVAYQAEPRRVAFSLPRSAHAQDLLGLALPAFDAQWSAVTDFPQSQESLRDWVINYDRPLLARVVVRRADPVYGGILNYGSAPSGGRSGRSWVSGTELIVLLGLAQVEVLEMWAASDAVELTELNQALQAIEPHHDLSLSIGLLMENIWSGVAGRLRPPPHIHRGRPHYNPWAPFVRARDRALCMLAAIRLQEAGLDVVSYGVGTVWVHADPSQTDAELAAIARRLDMVPTALAVPAEEDRGKDLNRPVGILQTLLIQGRRDQLLATDEAMVNQLLENVERRDG